MVSVCASLTPVQFPSLVIFYTTSDRKLGGDGYLGKRLYSYQLVVIMKSFSTFVHVLKLVYIYMSTVPRFQSKNIHRYTVNLASFSCSPYTKLTEMGLGIRLWLSTFSLMHIFRFCCQFITLTLMGKGGRWHGLRYSN